MKNAHDIIIKPIITEASMAMGQQRKYAFEVSRDATKPQIADAIEEIFKVDVECVNTIIMKRKPKRVRYKLGYISAWKKAIVTLKPESKTIEFFDGMM
ncbi:MAG: 50S ribosomal protein L23 [Eubacteriales bacterium]|jgi:large subunit ribosomal protein L23|nr:50S ribosomal protein L23 [Eubacteriales bacterium]